ncbi:ribonuclease kappa [Galendromus occidentalis]|uniref:Ribonuclease kappa n=1 Tax=Galendromus occidentalis TaxID=34638 RepID=A0AAJ7L7U4_9ACAR|nr:ribonuclease kappa [Galendromus occidentalis]
MPICGKKSAVMCSVLSAWGVIMLLLLGIFLRMNSVAFAEDLEIHAKTRSEYLIEINRKYRAASLNCWIAAGLYGVTLIVSFHQYCLNQKARNT